MLIHFCGPSYVYRSAAFDYQRAINIYPAKSESGTSKAGFIMCPTPGRQIFSNIPVQPIRGMWATVDRAFAVAFNTMYEVFPDGSFAALGTLNTFAGNVSMSDNGIQVIMVDGPFGYIFDLTTNIFTQITAMGFQGGTTVTFLDSYFIVNVPNTGIYQWSGIYDGTSWDPTDFANAEGSPDNLIALVTAHRQTYLIGGGTVEVINTSTVVDITNTDPFVRVQGVFIEYGTNAPFSVQQTANTVLWLGRDSSGANVVWQANGLSATRISTQAIENYLSRYDTSQATSYSYQEDGHYHYVLNIPGAPTCPAYDITLGQWHERSRWNTNSGFYERDRANFHIYAFGKHLVSDYENGNIYNQSLSFNMDDDVLMRRTRTLPYFVDDLEYLYFSQFQIDMQTGVGLNDDSNPENVDPHITLRWSDDGGNTWSTELAVPIGKIGQFRARAIWHRLGRSRFRIWEVSVSANVPVYMIAAHQEVTKGYA